MDDVADKPDKPRKIGRPRRGDHPPIPWDDIERAYVCGETIRQREDGSFERVYPSIRDLAEKFGVNRSLIGYHCHRHNWPEQRRAFRDKVRIESREAEAKARARPIEDALGILDRYLGRFREAVESGHVRVDAISDFNTAVRLKEFLRGGADSRQEIQGVVTLEQMQQRHARLREEVAAMDAQLAGVVPPEEGPEDDEPAVH